MSPSRSPCPALNALANHAFISPTGSDLAFGELVRAIRAVYNLSYPLAILLTAVGFATCGKISWRRPASLLSFLTCLIPSWTLDLSALSARGPHYITHDAAFVHPDTVPSAAPDPRMLQALIDYAGPGLALADFARYHAQRERAAATKLCTIHKQIALGECALAWLVLRASDSPAAIVPTERLRQWLGEERLPDGWWDGVRPSRTIGLWRARTIANLVDKLAATRI